MSNGKTSRRESLAVINGNGYYEQPAQGPGRANRICAYYGCNQKLSIWNKNRKRLCFCHRTKAWSREGEEQILEDIPRWWRYSPEDLKRKIRIFRDRYNRKQQAARAKEHRRLKEYNDKRREKISIYNRKYRAKQKRLRDGQT